MAGVFCLHGMSVFDLEEIIPRVNVLVRFLFQSRLLLWLPNAPIYQGQKCPPS